MSNNSTKDGLFSCSINRRSFIKSGAISTGLVMASSQLPLPFKKAYASTVSSESQTKVIWSACTVNCGSRCPLRMHVRNGEIVFVDVDNTPDGKEGCPQIRACLRGRSMRQRVYNPDRLKYPMKRVGKRGEGKFERISWDEALTIIADNLKRLTNEYGNESIYLNYGTGTIGGTITKSWPPSATMVARLMNCYGGYLNHYGDYSTAQIAMGLNYTYGGWADGNSLTDIENTQLVVLFGNNPAETRMSGGGLTHHFTQMLEKTQAKLIIIDPRYTDSLAGKEGEWIPIRPGTDAALASAIAYVLITEDLVDQAFLDKYCIGYDEKTLPADAPKNGHYKAYILGQSDDGIAKTPQWAEDITTIPAQRIIKLAREIAQAKPAYISQGWGPQRRANGETLSRAIAMLPILTGNVGISGGNSGARESSYSIPFTRMPTYTNPVKTSISMFLWTDAIYRAHEMTDTTDGVQGKERLTTPIKFIWNYASNCLINQHSDINKTHNILQDEKLCEMIVVIDNHMTSSAKYADIILPDCTASEQEDFCMEAGSGNTNSIIFAQQAITPRFECKNIYTIMSELSEKMGIKEQFTENKTQQQWLKQLYELSRQNLPELPDYETLKQQGIFKKRSPEGHFVAYEAFRQSPEKHPLTTPSGKIEIYSQRLADIANKWVLKKDDVIHPLPVYAAGFESHQDSKTTLYPLQLFGFHYKARVHSTYGNVKLIQQACRQEVWINPLDAKSRNIKQGDMVKVFNDRGETHLPAKVTPKIMPGVLGMGEGAWYQRDINNIDVGGCINTLTTLRPSPLAKGNPQHTNLVDIQKLS